MSRGFIFGAGAVALLLILGLGAFYFTASAPDQSVGSAAPSSVSAGLEDTTQNAGTNASATTNADTTLPDDVRKGVGAFVEPGDMDIDNWTTLEFVVGPDQTVIAEETEGRKLTPSATVYVAPTMRVTLLPDPNFEFQPQSDSVQDTGADRTATWQWKVKPHQGGNATLYARVEIGDRKPDGSLAVVKTYTRRVAVTVKVGTWKGFVGALKSAASLGDVIGTLVGSIGKTITAIAAMITAGPTVWLAIQAWRRRKQAKADAADGKTEAK